jgi:DNA-binding response OmpR family regulator
MATARPLAAVADGAPHLLVVDDDARIRSLLARFLSEAGYRVTTAASADDARVRLSGLTFDLLILDVMMPGENGIDFAASLRRTSQVPILMLTALGDPQDRIKGLESGVDDYVSKPFEPRELLLRINGILRRTMSSFCACWPNSAAARYRGRRWPATAPPVNALSMCRSTGCAARSSAIRPTRCCCRPCGVPATAC